MVQLKKIYTVIATLIYSTAAMASILDLGEKNFSLYLDATEPRFEKNNITGKVSWADHDYLEHYSLFHSNIDLMVLEKFILHDLTLGAACSNDEIYQNQQYLRYAHRLVVLSYLLELNQQLDYTAKKLHMGNACQTDWKKIKNMCGPKSDTMKFFLKNADQVISQITPIRVAAAGSGKKYWKKWHLAYKRNEVSSDPSIASVREFCDQNKCKIKKLEDARKIIPKVCKSNTERFLNICSEKDDLMALSYIPEMYELIGRSNILNSIDAGTNAEGCLRVYSLISARTEKVDRYLAKVIPALFSSLSGSSSYIQGRLFPAGALMEFNIKGLVQVFEDVKEIEKPIIPVKKEETKIIDEPTLEITEPEVKPPVVAAQPVSQPTLRSAKQVEPEAKKTAFLMASEFREKYDLDRVKVDMFKFKYDYIFTLDRSKKLEGSLQRFMRRDSLEEMKKLDGLGSQKAPVPLIFLKFMIDSKKHMELFNLTAVLGNRFYIKNTIDKVAPTWDYVNLTNDESTENKWQIYILKNNN